MKKQLFTTLLLLYVGYVNSQALLDKSGWQLHFSDEFNYSNTSTLWNNWQMDDPVSSNVGCQKDPNCETNIMVNNSNNVYVDGSGLLHLKTSHLAMPQVCSSGVAFRDMASIGSKFADNTTCNNGSGFMHGMFEARIKMAPGSNIFSTFWLMGQNAWPPEIDVFEYNGVSPNRFFSSIHWVSPNWHDENTGIGSYNCNSNMTVSLGIKSCVLPANWVLELKQKLVFKANTNVSMLGEVVSYNNSTGATVINIIKVIKGVGTYSNWSVICDRLACNSSHFINKENNSLSDDFHTYTATWSPNEVVWFFDGKEIRRETRSRRLPETDCTWRKMRIILSASMNCPGGSTPYSSEMLVDYVRVYKPKTENTSKNCVQNNYTSIDNSAHLIYATEPDNTAQSKMFVTSSGNLFYKGNDSRLWNYYWNGSGFSTAPINWNVTDVKAEITHDAVNSKIYYISSLNQLKFFSGSNSFNTSTNTNCDGFIEIGHNGGVYYKGQDNRLYLSKPNTIGNTHTVTVISNVTNVFGKIVYDPISKTVFYRGVDNNIWKTTFNTVTATHSNPIKITSTNNITNNIIWANDRLFYSTLNYQLYNYYFNGSVWLNDLLSYSPQDANCAGDLAIDQNGGRTLLYYKGVDGRLWYYFTDKGWNLTHGGKWYNSTSNNIANVSGPIIVRSDGNVYYRGSNSKIYENWLQTSTYTNRNDNNPDYPNITVYKTDNLDLESEVVEEEKNFSIYPNPSSGILNLLFLSEIDEKYSVEVHDVNGRLLYKNELIGIKGENNTKIDLSFLTKGVYFLHFFSSQNSKRQSFTMCH